MAVREKTHAMVKGPSGMKNKKKSEAEMEKLRRQEDRNRYKNVLRKLVNAQKVRYKKIYKLKKERGMASVDGEAVTKKLFGTSTRD